MRCRVLVHTGAAIFALVGLLVASGCTSIQVKADRVGQMKKVALIGFEGKVDMKDSKGNSIMSGGGVGGIAAMAKMSSGETAKEQVEVANWTYDNLVSRLTRTMGFEVQSRAQLSELAFYKDAYKTLIEDQPGTGMATAMGLLSVSPGIIWESRLRRMDMATRDQYIDALGVDAIACARVIWVTGDRGGFAIGGVGKLVYYPSARIEFYMFEKGVEEPIWYDRGATAEPSKEGVEQIMGVVKWTVMPPLLKEATANALDLMFVRYEKAASAPPAE